MLELEQHRAEWPPARVVKTCFYLDLCFLYSDDRLARGYSLLASVTHSAWLPRGRVYFGVGGLRPPQQGNTYPAAAGASLGRSQLDVWGYSGARALPAGHVSHVRRRGCKNPACVKCPVGQSQRRDAKWRRERRKKEEGEKKKITLTLFHHKRLVGMLMLHILRWWQWMPIMSNTMISFWKLINDPKSS